jgi:septum formation inhibitor-activating ATPase MinD
METVKENVRREIERVQEHVLPRCPAGVERSINETVFEARRALIVGDESMLHRALADLKGWET